MEAKKQTIKYKGLNNGKQTIIFHDYPNDYFNTQFSEIFQEGHYKGGLRKKNAIYVDLGANIGLSCLYFKDYAKKIYAIEPNNIYYNFLVENTKMFPQIETFNIGLGFDNGMATLTANPGDFRAETIFGSGGETQSFTMQTIEKFFEDNKIDHVDVLKIDVEGSEYPIFMSESFGKVADKIDFIIGEGHFKTNLRPDYIPTILGDYGFKVKFLPYQNMFNDYQLVGVDGTQLTKKYRTYANTIFEAYKE